MPFSRTPPSNQLKSQGLENHSTPSNVSSLSYRPFLLLMKLISREEVIFQDSIPTVKGRLQHRDKTSQYSQSGINRAINRDHEVAKWDLSPSYLPLLGISLPQARGVPFTCPSRGWRVQFPCAHQERAQYHDGHFCCMLFFLCTSYHGPRGTECSPTHVRSYGVQGLLQQRLHHALCNRCNHRPSRHHGPGTAKPESSSLDSDCWLCHQSCDRVHLGLALNHDIASSQ